MSDRARSSVRTGARGGSGTSDEVPDAAAPGDDGRESTQAITTKSPAPAAEPAGASATPSAEPRFDDVKPASGKPGKAAASGAAAPAAAAAPAPPAAHPVTPLAPAGRQPADGPRPAGSSAPPVPPATGSRPAVGRTAAPASGSQPVDSTQALPPAAPRTGDAGSRSSGGRPTDAAARAATEQSGKGGKRGAGRGPRRARLQLRHIDTWSALKISLVVSIALFFVWMVAVAVLYGVLGGLGVFDTLNELIGQLSTASGSDGGGGDVITAKVVLLGAAVIGAVNIVLLTALCTVAAFVYNLCSDLVGGLEVTLAERE